MKPILQVKKITKSYSETPVIQNLSFQLNQGEIGCLLGESGSGKTTVLRCIAGFEQIQGGKILLNNQFVSDRTHHTPPEKRRIGMVFQDYALFPHLTVRENIAFGLFHLPKNEQRAITAEMLDLVDLTPQKNRYPHEISGGQQQRVALARALAIRPSLLLMDEPFSNLDVTLTERLLNDVRNILNHLNMSALLVTHNQSEAFSLADRIGVMRKGKLMQWDTCQQLYDAPKSEWVADFIGKGTFISGEVISKNEAYTPLGKLNGDFSTPVQKGCKVKVLIRPEHLTYDPKSKIKGLIIRKTFKGPAILYTLELEDSECIFSLFSSKHAFSVGERIGIRTSLKRIVLFKK